MSAESARTASALCGAQTSPYTVSVGMTTSRPRESQRCFLDDVIARAGPRPPGRGRRDPSSFGVGVAELGEKIVDARGVILRGLEHEGAAPPQPGKRPPRYRVGRTLAHQRDPRLPLANLGLERRRSRPRGRTAGWTRRGARALPEAPRTDRVNELDRVSGTGSVLARDLEGVSRGVDRGDPRPRGSSAIASAIAPLPVPTSRTRGAVEAPRCRARQRSTTISVSGRGTSTRESTLSVRRRNPHSPRTYASGSRSSRRATRRSSSSSDASPSSRRVRTPSPLRVVPSTWASEDLGIDVG